jgi:RNA polymerase sigma-70 factor (ECF subfamily)
MVILLRDIEELTTAEAAERLGIEEGALKVRLHRARAALRTLLEPVWKEAQA